MSRIDKNDAPSLVLARFPNLSGALVPLTANERGRYTTYSWQCGGCLKDAKGLTLDNLRDGANEHAATCRALPQPARADKTAA